MMGRLKSAPNLHAELRELKASHARVSAQAEKYRRFIKETHWSEYLQWMARDIGINEETVSELAAALDQPRT